MCNLCNNKDYYILSFGLGDSFSICTTCHVSIKNKHIRYQKMLLSILYMLNIEIKH